MALPNKLVSDLIVYNRTRTLEAAPQPSAAVAAAPLRRVLCFTLQLDRSLEPQLDDIRDDVRALLNQITKDQLIQSGLTPDPEEEGDTSATSSSSSSHDGDTSTNDNNAAQKPDTTDGPVAVAAAAVAAAAGLAAAAAGQADRQQGGHQSSASADKEDASSSSSAASREEGSGSPEPEPLLVSITLKQLTESKISLFVRYGHCCH